MFNLDVAEWKRVRAICSPIFTSGKLKAMIPLMDRCIDNLLSYIDSKIEESERPGFINVKQTLSGFSIDVIAATTFATDTHANGVLNKKGVDSSEASDKKTSDFVHYGTSIFKVPPLKVAAALCLPRPLLNLLGISTFFSEASFEFLISLSRKIFRKRQSSKSKPAVPDLIQLMSENFTTDQALNSSGYDHLTASMDHEPEEQEKSTVLESKSSGFSQNGSKPNFSSKRMLDENEILGQLVLFFFAGFETTAFTLTTALFELAHQPEIQERLYCELTSFSDKFNSNKEEYYDQLLNHAPYLAAVIKETLRKHPNVVRLERRVSAPEGATLGKVHLDQDVLVEVPILAVHHNPNFYPEPELYNPERFMPENRDRLVPYAYLPFGGGPKNCLGMRFAYQEMKLCLARVLSRYRFSLAADTPTRLIYAKGAQLLV
ncbi:PREDICTED: cytochrome P450 3A41-like, partial [Rhagoletis zephyria]|uniref:cytochrome P450 3A41-like n=1 Tax=Rhagoletis zephyria TaxID=28612 RepID=UPI0008112D56